MAQIFIQVNLCSYNNCEGNQGPPDSARSQQYNQGQLDCYYGKTIPGNHTPEYIAGCKEGTHQRAISPPPAEEEPTKPPAHTNDNYRVL